MRFLLVLSVLAGLALAEFKENGNDNDLRPAESFHEPVNPDDEFQHTRMDAMLSPTKKVKVNGKGLWYSLPTRVSVVAPLREMRMVLRSVSAYS
ncbi:hypothetical protein E4U21_003379 [Claviceps maximensis]|nr:hypothetical protein E4U21_003379 [Claviceps maximensis]